MIILLSAALLALAILGGRLIRGPRAARLLERAEGLLRRWGAYLTAVATLAILWSAWSELNPIPVVSDEVSYVLQSEIFASGRWTAPSPPAPEFFEQPHVLVEPRVASKYPPGHALLLVPGALLHFPALVPLLLGAASAALLFLLVARVTNVWVALLSWALWITAPMVLRFMPSYFSEVSTTALVLGAWWTLLRWHDARRTRWLAALACIVGWGAITRPLTMLALALPIAVVVIHDVVRGWEGGSRWRDLAIAVCMGIAILGLLPLWNARTTGSWRLSPIELYRRDYLPFDKMGFSFDASPPRRALAPPLATLYAVYSDERRRERRGALPETALERFRALVVATFQVSRLPLVVFAIIGLFASPPAIRFATLSALLLFLAHLGYAHVPTWTLYYVETMPVVAAVIACGIWRTASSPSELSGNSALAFAAVAVLAGSWPTFTHERDGHRARAAVNRSFNAGLRNVPDTPAVVFVRYSARPVQHIEVVLNSEHLDREPVWVVHDLGDRNSELLKRAPNRAWYVFAEDSGWTRAPRATGEGDP